MLYPDAIAGPDAGPLVVAHRGGAGLGPENTLPTMARALAAGAHVLEVDVRLSADGVPVLVHDADLRRVCGTAERVDRTDWSQLRRRRVPARPGPGGGGAGLTSLAELLEAFPGVPLSLDVKDARVLGPMARVLRQGRALHRVCIGGLLEAHLADARALCGPGTATALGWESVVRLMLAARAGRRPGIVWAPFAHVPMSWGRLPLFSERVMPLARELGIRVMVWTVQEETAMARLVGAGVDGVVTDHPHRLSAVLSGAPAPATRDAVPAAGRGRPGRGARPVARRPHGPGPASPVRAAAP